MYWKTCFKRDGNVHIIKKVPKIIINSKKYYRKCKKGLKIKNAKKYQMSIKRYINSILMQPDSILKRNGETIFKSV